jgi:hypothetical protein
MYDLEIIVGVITLISIAFMIVGWVRQKAAWYSSFAPFILGACVVLWWAKLS